MVLRLMHFKRKSRNCNKYFLNSKTKIKQSMQNELKRWSNAKTPAEMMIDRSIGIYNSLAIVATGFTHDECV